MRSESNGIGRQGILALWLAAGVATSACGSFVESDGHVARATIGVGGGALKLDALSLDVPAHALDHTVTFSLSQAAEGAPDGHAFTLDPPDAVFDPAVPAALAISYDAAIYQHPSEVFVAMFSAGAWHMLPAAGAMEVGVAHATTTHTGTFGVLHCPGGLCP